jgi:hypothetical protein
VVVGGWIGEEKRQGRVATRQLYLLACFIEKEKKD